MYAYSAPRFR